MNQQDKQIWNRVVERRRQECAALDKGTVLQMLSPLVVGTSATDKSPSELMEYLLKNHFDIASNPSAKALDRRIAFDAIQQLRKKLDESLAKQPKSTALEFSRNKTVLQSHNAAAAAVTIPITSPVTADAAAAATKTTTTTTNADQNSETDAPATIAATTVSPTGSASPVIGNTNNTSLSASTSTSIPNTSNAKLSQRQSFPNNIDKTTLAPSKTIVPPSSSSTTTTTTTTTGDPVAAPVSARSSVSTTTTIPAPLVPTVFGRTSSGLHPHASTMAPATGRSSTYTGVSGSRWSGPAQPALLTPSGVSQAGTSVPTTVHGSRWATPVQPLPSTGPRVAPANASQSEHTNLSGNNSSGPVRSEPPTAPRMPPATGNANGPAPSTAPGVPLANSGGTTNNSGSRLSTSTTYVIPSSNPKPGVTAVTSEPPKNGNMNKTRATITADLAAAAASTAQEAASSVTDPLAPSTTKAIPSRQTPAVMAPPPYQRKSDTVTATEKTSQSTKKFSHGNPTGGTPNASSADFVPPTLPSTNKRLRQQDVEDMDISENDEPETNDPKHRQASQSLEPAKKTPKLNHHTPPSDIMDPTTKVSLSQTVLEFPPDTKGNGDARTSFAQADRPAVKISFRKHWPSNEMSLGAGRLFEVWEPYWQVEKVVASGVTSLVEKWDWKAKPLPHKDVTNIPRTVATFELPSLTGAEFSKISWGTLKSQATSKPKDGDCTLLLRMLPIKRKPDELKKRANTHLWPIGTFLMINRMPTSIYQRKQASHDCSKWEYLSHPLELSFYIKNPKERTSISMCCQDPTQYFYMVSVCSYKSPATLKDRLLQPDNHFLHCLSLEESSDKAMDYINKNSMISIDDEDDGQGNEDAGILIFSLVDPVSKVLMKTPVRGQKCKHWQCFDLQSFMEVNAPVSGGRWRCVCCEQFINYQELEVCGLTKEALVRFEGVASATRDRVEFRADRTMNLLPAPKLRFGSKRRQQSGGSTQPQQVKNPQTPISDPIEVIDLD